MEYMAVINLLPIEAQKEIRSRRINLILFKYLIALAASAAFLITALLSTNIFLNIIKNSDNQIISSDNSDSSESRSIQTKLQNASVILSQQKSYSKLLLGISEALPEGVILNKININKASIDSSISAEFSIDQNITIEKLKTDLENSSLFNSVVLNPIDGENGNKVSALLSINSEVLR